MTGSMQIKARTRYTASNWSALNEATFAVGPVKDNLRITEMMYHPKDTGDPINDPNAEYIELKNIHDSTTINLNLVKFTNGIDFTFPSFTLDPGDSAIVVKDQAVFASRFSTTGIDPYLVGHWAMDDNASNTNVADSSGNANHGTAQQNTSLLNTTGKIDDALTFNGTSDFVDLGNLIGTGAYTKIAWIKRADVSAHNNIISGNTSHAFWAPSSYSSKLSAGHNGTWNAVQDSEPLDADLWYQVAVTFDPAVGSGTMVLYKNGTPVDIATSVPVPSPPSTSTYIGRFSSDYFFSGSIDNVMIFDTALTPEEIGILYVTGLMNIVPGQYTGRISNAGERIELQDALGKTIHNFSFKDGWYHITDGSGFSLNIINPNDPEPNNWEYSEFWQPGSVIGGTPGADDSGHAAAPEDVVINEVMTHTDTPPNDWIELHNTTGSAIDISGWFLSDSENDFKKYEVASGTSIPDNGYIVFTEDANFGLSATDPGSNTGFALSEHGETVYLSSGLGGDLAGGFCTKEDFKAAENGVTFGRYTKSAASGYDVDFVAMQSSTMDSANSTAEVGDIVITEIMYHPATTGQLNNYAEYIELYNASGGTISLDDWLLTDEDNAIEFYIPAGTSLGSGQYLLLVKDLVAFEDEFGTPIVTAFEWVEGRLSNAGEKVQISKPGNPEPSFVPYIRVDRVNYSDGSHHLNFHELSFVDPWPTQPDGTGQSLHRISTGAYGNDVANWTNGAASPGS
jgi:hypothetical protein